MNGLPQNGSPVICEMSCNHYTGHDGGTGGTRALIMDDQGDVFASATGEHAPFASPEIGRAEFILLAIPLSVAKNGLRIFNHDDARNANRSWVLDREAALPGRNRLLSRRAAGDNLTPLDFAPWRSQRSGNSGPSPGQCAAWSLTSCSIKREGQPRKVCLSMDKAERHC